MRHADPDAAMAYEFKQQELINGILQGLYSVANHLDIDSDVMYAQGARYLLGILSAETEDSAKIWKIPFGVHVVAKVEKFTEEPTERTLLLYRVFKELVEGMGHAIYHEYRKTEILTESEHIDG